ncbi:MAG: DUF1176 domain-containing protein [Limnospira sp.]
MASVLPKLSLFLAIGFSAGTVLAQPVPAPPPSSPPSPDAAEPTSEGEEVETIPELPPVPFMIPDEILEYFYQNPDGLDICPGVNALPFRLGSFAYPFGPEAELVQLLCYRAAYQGGYNFFRYQETDGEVTVEPLEFSGFEMGARGELVEAQIREIVGELEYQPAEGILSVFTKDRGVGDCGTFVKYEWDGTQFNAIEYRVKSECDGNYIEPQEYPRLYP